MKIYKTKTWQYEKTGIENEVVLFDINIFDYLWKPTGKRAKVKRPSGDICSCAINKITADGKENEFIAIEAGNGVWEFYTFKF